MFIKTTEIKSLMIVQVTKKKRKTENLFILIH